MTFFYMHYKDEHRPTDGGTDGVTDSGTDGPWDGRWDGRTVGRTVGRTDGGTGVRGCREVPSSQVEFNAPIYPY